MPTGLIPRIDRFLDASTSTERLSAAKRLVVNTYGSAAAWVVLVDGVENPDEREKPDCLKPRATRSGPRRS